LRYGRWRTYGFEVGLEQFGLGLDFGIATLGSEF